MKPGIYPGLSRAEYDGIDAINFSLLKHMRRSPAHLQHEAVMPQESSDAQVLGQLVHTVCLAKSATMDRFAVAPKCDKRTKAGKAEYAEFVASSAGKPMVDADDLATAFAIRAALERHPAANDLLYGEGVQYEVGIIWNDPVSGLPCKGLVDCLTAGGVIVDLKSTLDASPGGFGREAAKYLYHAQMAWYWQGLMIVGDGACESKFPVMVAVEKSGLHATGVYGMAVEHIQAGYAAHSQWMSDYAACAKSGVWPAYSNEIVPLQLPAWAMREDGDEDLSEDF